MDVLGTSVKASMNTEDRDLFVKELNKVDLKVPVSHACENMEEAVAAARNIGYPIMIRSAYALGGGSVLVSARQKRSSRSWQEYSNRTRIYMKYAL